jgi:hypothetical protein
MRRSTLLLLLALSGTANAALSRVSLESPLAPVSPVSWIAAPSALSVSAAPLDFDAAPVPLAFPAALPAPARAEAAAAALPNPAAPLAPAAAGAARPKIVDALKPNAPPSDSFAAPAPNESAEDSVQALENVFDQAEKPADAAPDPLLARLLQHVRLDDGGIPERRAALTRAVERMLESPAARTLAERFIADGNAAVVRFDAFEGSKIQVADGRKTFYGTHGSATWQADHVKVIMNQDYLESDEELRHQELPAYLAHELFGHGLWLPRVTREDLFLAYKHHDLNEHYARLVQWLVDFELDHRFERGGGWGYLQNPSAFLSGLKLRHSSYATTWSTAELARPRETLEERSKEARAAREKALVNLANHSSWNKVIDHFASQHEVAESRLRALRAYMTERAQIYQFDIGTLDAVIAEVDALVGRMNAETDRGSEQYLRQAATHPLFADLQTETDESVRRLIELANGASAQPESEASVKASEDHWRGQITFDQLVKMYKKDKKENPAHWLN